MTPYWFSKKLPASRTGIENAVRLAFWAGGFGETYFTCTRAESPIQCNGLWKSSTALSIEWSPMEYFQLKLKEPDKDVLEAFERVLGHRALAAYRDPKGEVVVEWRPRDPLARWEELEKSGAPDLERLS